MELYADLFLLVNFFCDLIVLSVCARLLCRRVKRRRLLAGGAIGALYALLWMLLYPAPILLLLLSAVFSVLMVLVTFGFHGGKTFLKALGFFYLVCLLFGGGVSGICSALGKISSPLFSLLLLTLCLALSSLFCLTVGRAYGKNQQKKNALLIFFAQGKEYEATGLWDSGNLLHDPESLLPVVLLDPALFEKPPPCDRLVPVTTAAGKSTLPAFLPENALIDGIPRQICIALCAPQNGSFGGAQALLPPF